MDELTPGSLGMEKLYSEVFEMSGEDTFAIDLAPATAHPAYNLIP